MPEAFELRRRRSSSCCLIDPVESEIVSYGTTTGSRPASRASGANMNFENKLPTTTTLDTSDGVSEVSKDAKNPFDTPPISPIGESPSSLDFKNDLPSTTAASHESNTATEVYQNSDVFISGKPPKQRSCCKPTRKYTTRRIYLTDLVMHLLSVAFAIPTLILYSLDLAYSNNYFAKLHPHESRGHMPAAISVLSPFGITGANMSLIWSLQYLYFDRRLAKERELDRKWRTLYDAFLWVWTLAVSDATFSVRTNSSNCTSLGLEDWGACNGARPGIMIAAGICSVMLSYVS